MEFILKVTDEEKANKFFKKLQNKKETLSRNKQNKTKVYLVELSNNTYTGIDKVFTTYHGASQWLIDEGFEPYADKWFGEWRLLFCYEDEGWNDEDARIIEMDVNE